MRRQEQQREEEEEEDQQRRLSLPNITSEASFSKLAEELRAEIRDILLKYCIIHSFTY